MTALDYSKKRLHAFLEEARRLQELEFPYPYSKQALQQIHDTIATHLSFLDKLVPESDPKTVSAACKSTVSALAIYLPFLGFILRSTDVRNAFEIYGPLLRFSRQILGESTKLILSSEWDYSPFTYHNVPILKDFVLIGLPSTEAANPLLIPLAGHELGHPVWNNSALHASIAPRIEAAILTEITDRKWNTYTSLFKMIDKADLTTDLFAKQTWQPAYNWALRQAEESFCDFFGVRLFRDSFFHAFAYLLAPNLGGFRPHFYPNMKRRVSEQAKAAGAYGIPAPVGYEDMFEDLPVPTDIEGQSKFLLELADLAATSLTDDLIETANSIAKHTGIVEPTAMGVSTIDEDFRQHIIPARKPESLVEILSASWKAFHDVDLWKERPDLPRDDILKELVLKSIEVLEYIQIVEGRA